MISFTSSLSYASFHKYKYSSRLLHFLENRYFEKRRKKKSYYSRVQSFTTEAIVFKAFIAYSTVPLQTAHRSYAKNPNLQKPILQKKGPLKISLTALRDGSVVCKSEKYRALRGSSIVAPTRRIGPDCTKNYQFCTYCALHVFVAIQTNPTGFIPPVQQYFFPNTRTIYHLDKLIRRRRRRRRRRFGIDQQSRGQ